MSEDHELAQAVREQVAALNRSNAVRATDLAMQNVQAGNAHAKWIAGTKAGLRTTALNLSTKLNSDSSVEEILDDAEKMLSWLEVPLAALTSDNDS